MMKKAYVFYYRGISTPYMYDFEIHDILSTSMGVVSVHKQRKDGKFLPDTLVAIHKDFMFMEVLEKENL